MDYENDERMVKYTLMKRILKISLAIFVILAMAATAMPDVMTARAMTSYKSEILIVTIAYNANGGNGAPKNQSAEIIDGVATYKLSQQKPYRTGYRFTGWRLDNSTAYDIDSPGQSIAIGLDESCTLTYYAQWEKDSETSNGASAKWKKACREYNTWLEKNCSKFKAELGDFYTENPESYKKADSFLIVDLNKDGVPELVTKHPCAYKMDDLYVYTYKRGKVKQIKGLYGTGESASICVCCNAAGWYSVYRCKKGHLHTVWKDTVFDNDSMAMKDNIEHSVYTVKNGRIKLYAKGTEIFFPADDYSYTINGKKVGSKKFHSMINKCGKLNSGMHSNTADGRRKYLK